MGCHIADHYFISALPQPIQSNLRLLGAVDGNDVQIMSKQITKGVGWLRNAGEPYDGVETGIVLSHFYGPQDIVDRQPDGDDGNISKPLDELGRPPTGDDHVIVLRAVHSVHGYLWPDPEQVPHPQRESTLDWVDSRDEFYRTLSKQ